GKRWRFDTRENRGLDRAGRLQVQDGRSLDWSAEVEAAADDQRHGHDKTLVAVRSYDDLGRQRLALSIRHGRDNERNRRRPAVEPGSANLQPGLVADGVRVDWPLFVSLDFQGVSDRV